MAVKTLRFTVTFLQNCVHLLFPPQMTFREAMRHAARNYNRIFALVMEYQVEIIIFISLVRLRRLLNFQRWRDLNTDWYDAYRMSSTRKYQIGNSLNFNV